MRLYEDTQEEVIETYQQVIDIYKTFREECEVFRARCENEKQLKSEGNYFYDFVSEELWDKLKNTADEILDLYYPIDYADDEDDLAAARERYQSSIEAREKVFNF